MNELDRFRGFCELAGLKLEPFQAESDDWVLR
jgi:hypothetical protein